MGGLRAKDSKPKKVNDFKKVKAKVGKKVNRGPVTVIRVKSKKIIMSVQKSLQEKSGDEISQITLLTRQFHHHSASNRLIALTGVKELLESSEHTESYIALILPAAMELLFDEEKDTRKALLSFVDSLTKKYPQSAFESIASVISTYCCSGLTSLKKDIRHDALALLLQFLKNRTASIFVYDLSKLLQHVSSLLSLSSHNQKASVTTSSSGSGNASNSKKGGGPLQSQPTGRKVNDKNKSAEKSSSFLVSTLEVLEALIKLSSSSSNTLTTTSRQAVQYIAPDDEASKGTLLIYPLKKISTAGTPTFLSSSQNGANNNKQSAYNNSGAGGGTSTPGSSPSDVFVSLRTILEDVCCRLSPIWSGLVYEGSIISKHAWGPLCLISRIGVILSELFPSLDSVVTAESAKVVVEIIKYDNFLVSMFSGFPYVLFESTVAMPGSKEELEARHFAGILNIAVSEATLLWCKQSQVSKLMQTSIPNGNLKNSLKMNKDSAHFILETVHLHSTMTYVHTSLTFLNDSLSNKASSPTSLMAEDLDDYLQRLFHCISMEVLFLSEKSSARNVNDQQSEASSDGDEEAVGHVLNDLCMLIRFSVEMLSSLSFSHANSCLINRLTFILKSTVTCASHITASETLLWETTNNTTISKITLLTQTLSLLPKRMVDICRKSAVNSTSSLQIDQDISLSDSEYVVYISLSTLLLLLRRCSARSQEEYTSSDNESDNDDDNSRARMEVTSSAPSETMWNRIVVEVSTQIGALFSESDGEGGHADADDGLDREDSVFALYSFPTRMLLLDIWYYCRFENFEQVVEDSIISVTGTRSVIITSIEQEKMLYLLFSRRSEMGVTSFVSSLIRGFETCVVAIFDNYVDENGTRDNHSSKSMDVENSVPHTSAAETCQNEQEDQNQNQNEEGEEEEEEEDEESLLLEVAEQVTSSDWIVNKIATTLYQCGSSNSPHLIAKYTLRALQDMVTEEDLQYEETDLYCYSVGIFSILQSLLAPFHCEFPSQVSTVILNSPPAMTDTGTDVDIDVDTVEGILYNSTELMADYVIRLLLCRVDATNATSKMLKLGFRLLREGEPLANSLLFPIFNGLVTRWEYESVLVSEEEGGEESTGDMNTGFKVYSFDVFLLVLHKIGNNLSEFKTEEVMCLLDSLFEIMQYWKLSEDINFENYKISFIEKLNQWRDEKTITFAENQKLKVCIDDIIVFIGSKN